MVTVIKKGINVFKENAFQNLISIPIKMNDIDDQGQIASPSGSFKSITSGGIITVQLVSMIKYTIGVKILMAKPHPRFHYNRSLNLI